MTRRAIFRTALIAAARFPFALCGARPAAAQKLVYGTPVVRYCPMDIGAEHTFYLLQVVPMDEVGQGKDGGTTIVV